LKQSYCIIISTSEKSLTFRLSGLLAYELKLPYTIIDGNTHPEWLEEIVSIYLEQHIYQDFVLDGVPTTRYQAKFLAKYLEKLKMPTLIVLLKTEKEESERVSAIKELAKLTNSEIHTFDSELPKDFFFDKIIRIVLDKI
jgi:adenylate kinase family enzyme